MIKQLKYRLINCETNEITELDFTNRTSFLIGRDDRADIRFGDMTISREHCEIVSRDGRVYIKDLNSTNGTSVDRTVLQPYIEAELHEYSAIRLAGTVLLFRANADGEGRL